jgi:hypothetical protein
MRYFFLFFMLLSCAHVQPKKVVPPPQVIQIEQKKTFVETFRLEHPDYSHVTSCEWKGAANGIYALAFNLKNEAKLTVLSQEKIYFETSVKLVRDPKHEDYLTIYCDSFAKVKNFIETSREEEKEKISIQVSKKLFQKIPLDNPVLSFSRASSTGITFYYFDGSTFQILAKIFPKAE